MKRPGVLAVGIIIGLLAGVALRGQVRLRSDINLPGHTAREPFSDGVFVWTNSSTFYLSGCIGTDPRTKKPPDDVEREIRLLLDGVKATLAATQMSMDDLVSVQIFCTDLSLYDRFNSIYRTYFKNSLPAGGFVGAVSLLYGAHFEIQGVAVKFQ